MFTFIRHSAFPLAGVIVLAAIVSWLPAAEPMTADVASRVERARKDLVSLDPETRLQAARTLGDLGPAAAEAIPQLIERLNDHGSGVAREASRALASIGTAAIPALIEALREEDDTARWWAASAIEELGPEARDAVPALIESLDNDERPVHNAPSALSAIGMSAIGPTLEVLKSPDSSMRARTAAAQTLGAIGPRANAAVPALIEALGDRRGRIITFSPETSYPAAIAAAHALGAIGPDAAQAIGPLVKLLADPNQSLSRSAIEALGGIGPSAVEATPALVALLNYEDHEVGVHVSRSLAQFGPAARDAAKPLVEFLLRLDGEKEGARHEIVSEALIEIGRPAIAPLVASFARADVDDKPRIIRALSMVVTGGHTLVGIAPGGITIMTTMPSGPAPVQADIIASMPTLLAALREGNSAVRDAALEAIVALGPSGIEALPAIIETFDDREPGTRVRATAALLSIGPAARSALPALLTALADRSADVRRAAATAVSVVGGETDDVAEPLTTVAAKDRDRDVRAAAAAALRRLRAGHTNTSEDANE